MRRLTNAWLLLIALVAATTALATFDGRVVSAALLALAWFKARVILGDFLHLRGAPGWSTLASAPLAIWLTALWVLYAV